MRNRAGFTVVEGCLALIILALLVGIPVALYRTYESARVINGTRVACVGVAEDREPAYTWDVSGRNVIVGAVAFSTVLVPGYVLLKDFYCPVAARTGGR